MVKALVGLGADVHAKGQGNFTSLHVAAQFGHVEVVKTLVAVGADVHAQQQDGASPLHLAASRGHLEAVKALLQSGASVQALDNMGLTAQQLAAHYGHSQVAQWLATYSATSAAVQAAAHASPAAAPPRVSSHENPTRPKVCAWCGKTTARSPLPKLISCARCRAIRYCRRRCQSRHWEAAHRQECCAWEEP